VRRSGDGVAQVCLGFDAVELCGANKRVEQRCPPASGIAAGEQPVFPAKSNRASILPMSGRMSSSIIVGIRCTGAVRVASRVSGGQRVSSCMSS
jgi:hypothetical protein